MTATLLHSIRLAIPPSCKPPIQVEREIRPNLTVWSMARLHGRARGPPRPLTFGRARQGWPSMAHESRLLVILPLCGLHGLIGKLPVIPSSMLAAVSILSPVSPPTWGNPLYRRHFYSPLVHHRREGKITIDSPFQPQVSCFPCMRENNSLAARLLDSHL